MKLIFPKDSSGNIKAKLVREIRNNFNGFPPTEECIAEILATIERTDLKGLEVELERVSK